VHREPALHDRPHGEHETHQHVPAEGQAHDLQRRPVAGGQVAERRHPEAAQREHEPGGDEHPPGQLVPTAPTTAQAGQELECPDDAEQDAADDVQDDR
jgi:hypothetical protein